MAGVVAARQLVLLSNPTKQAALLASGGVTKVSQSRLCFELYLKGLLLGDDGQDAQQDLGQLTSEI